MINKVVSRFLAIGLGLSASFFAPIMAQNTPLNAKKEKQAKRNAQINQMIKQEEEGALIFHKQSLFGAKLNSDGFSVLYERGYLKTPMKTNLFGIEIGERKSPKQQKVTATDADGFQIGNAYIYGKINNFYYLKLNVGQSYLIGGKGLRNGVAISALYNGGVSLGVLKPYFVNLIDPASSETKTIRYGENTDDDALFLDQSVRKEGSGVFKGFGNMKVKPGLFAKVAVRFDYGRYNELVSAIETGFNAEYYFGKMPIMALVKERSLFTNVFVALEFGRRK